MVKAYVQLIEYTTKVQGNANIIQKKLVQLWAILESKISVTCNPTLIFSFQHLKGLSFSDLQLRQDIQKSIKGIQVAYQDPEKDLATRHVQDSKCTQQPTHASSQFQRWPCFKIYNS